MESLQLPVLKGGRVTLRPLAEGDADPLAAAVNDPSIRRWWNFDVEPESVREGFYNEGTAFSIDVDGELAGWLAVNEENEPDYRHAALDIMLLPPFQGRGLGPEALRTAIRWLIDERGHHRFTIDPALANKRAISAYQAVGFRPVGVMRQYDRTPDGDWEDGLLMDLLAGELR
jgi:aminoglycoside 6'-N-acetyltransferase